ncbi:Aste57867_22605 [Aphanomyces stellatus]|uniref:Aste57867_22605 protein n=1 Tax=Aphanomyces stellatus TaxID=120398 RepID=A0A485LLC2_9STRA|nr:hypothetical protein As57867_022535 [Aphanomyces stellatus]VFT99262.1 Aste57867_22605 [Aphanomyces stellatus]
MPALDYLVETCRLQDVPASLNKTQVADANKSFRGVKITVTHRGTVDRQYRVNRLKRSAKETMMEVDGGGRMNIADYFAQNYRPLRYPNLPLLHVGSPSNTIYMPMEVCNIMGGYKCPRKATDNQVANMITHTATHPENRRQKIEQRVREPILKWTIHWIRRELAPPDMLYSGNKTLHPSNGAWNMRNIGLFQGMKLSSYAVLSLCDPRRTTEADILDFFKALVEHMKGLGMLPRQPSRQS